MIREYFLTNHTLTITTDNGSNFVKACRMFPPKADEETDDEIVSSDTSDTEGSKCDLLNFIYQLTEFII